MHNAVAGEPGADTVGDAAVQGDDLWLVRAASNRNLQPICNKMSAGFQSSRLLLSASDFTSVCVTVRPLSYQRLHTLLHWNTLAVCYQDSGHKVVGLCTNPLLYIQSVLCSYFWVNFCLQCTNIDTMFSPSVVCCFCKSQITSCSTFLNFSQYK